MKKFVNKKKGKPFSEKEARVACIDFYKRLSDFYSVYKPDLNIIDGIIARDGDGFTRGKNIKMNCVLLSDNAFAVDYIGAYIMGFDPRNIGYLKYLKESCRPENIQVIGSNLEKLRKKFEVKLLTGEVL